MRNVNDTFFELMEEMDSKVKTKETFDQAMQQNYTSAVLDLQQVIAMDTSDTTAFKLLQVCKVMAEEIDDGSTLLIVTDALGKKILRDAFEKFLKNIRLKICKLFNYYKHSCPVPQQKSWKTCIIIFWTFQQPAC